MKEKKSGISVIMSVYNSQKYLEEAIESILNQSYRDFEFIIIDDYSDDDSGNIISAYAKADARIRIIKNKENLGLTRSLNIGIMHAKGKYIARMDADDISLPYRLKTQYDFLERNKGVFLVASRAINIDDNGELLDVTPQLGSKDKIARILKKDNCLIHPSIMFRNTGILYREKFETTQDYDVYLRLLSMGKTLGNIDVPLIKYRECNRGNVSQNKNKKQLAFTILAKQLYKERVRYRRDGKDLQGGHDSYDVTEFDVSEILRNAGIDEELVEQKSIENKISMFLRLKDYAQARKTIKSLKLSFRKLTLYVFSFIPALYSLYRAVSHRKCTEGIKTLGLFFSMHSSVKEWDNSGLLEREKHYYEEMVKRGIFHEIYWFTYGASDADFTRKLSPCIKIVPMPKIFSRSIGTALYSVLLPIIHRRALKRCSVLKTNQMSSIFPAILSKLLYRKILIVRSGYTKSMNYLASKSWVKFFFSKINEYIAYSYANAAIVTSESQRSYLHKTYANKNIFVVPNHVNTSVFKPRIELDRYKGEFGSKFDNEFRNKSNNKYHKDNGKIIFVGRLSSEKNLFNLIRAVSETGYSLDIYGKGPMHSDLRFLINRLSNPKRIKLKGAITHTNLAKIFPQYRLYILPSYYEGMPKSLIEAMSAGLCCIGTDVQGINDIINDRKNGILTKTDKESLKKGIKSAMNNHSLRNTVGEAAREYVQQNFDINTIVEREGDIYDQQF